MMQIEKTGFGLSNSPIAEPLFEFPGFRGDILSTKGILGEGVVGLGSQFREEASVYDERYFNVENKVSIILRALSLIGITPKKDCVALDIGCGSGGATFAILQMFDQSRVFSTDLSPEMLSILLRRADSIGESHRIRAFVSNASALSLKAESFDLIIGSSMVHHLVDPEDFVEKILRSIAPNGVAMFFEPFQAGHVLIRTLLLSLVEIAEFRPGFPPEQIQFFKNYAHTIEVMVSRDRPDDLTRRLDDKWMFCKKQFQDIGARSGCRVGIFATNPPVAAFEHKIASLVYAGLGQSLKWPDWALNLVRKADMCVDADLRQELLMEGCIVYAKE